MRLVHRDCELKAGLFPSYAGAVCRLGDSNDPTVFVGFLLFPGGCGLVHLKSRSGNRRDSVAAPQPTYTAAAALYWRSHPVFTASTLGKGLGTGHGPFLSKEI